MRAQERSWSKAKVVTELVRVAQEMGGKATDARVSEYNRELAVQDETIEAAGGRDWILRADYSNLNEALAQRLLTEAKPRRSIWSP